MNEVRYTMQCTVYDAQGMKFVRMIDYDDIRTLYAIHRT